MHVQTADTDTSIAPGERAVIGRSRDVELPVGDPDDRLISRRAVRLEFDQMAWKVANIGRRSVFLVAAGAEIELFPAGTGRDSTLILHADCWIRIPAERDIAVEIHVPASERPPLQAVLAIDGEELATRVEGEVTLTDNERRSVIAVYEGYLRLPPRYRREPNSYRAAARRLRVEEGKVKADLRRVQQKVARAGGVDEGGSRARDALIRWLLARQVITQSDLTLLDG